MAIATTDKPVVEKELSSGSTIAQIAIKMGYTWREVNNYLHGQGLTGGVECRVPHDGIDKAWLLDYAHVDIRKRNKAIRKAQGSDCKLKERALSRMYHALCRVEGSPEPYTRRGGECEKCPKWGLCSWDYVRCESIQDWEGDSVNEILMVIESRPEVYEDCYPVGQEEN